MRPEKVRDHLRRVPFRPFRIHMSDGSSYEVRHPEFVFVTRYEIYVAIPAAGDAVPERAVFCDPLHVTRIEPVDGTEPG